MSETTQPAVAGPVEPTVRQHTERAKRAAAVLAERGWSVTENDGVSCHKCGADLMRDARYCYQCGEPARNFTRGTLDDLEAAIAAAVDGAAVAAERERPRQVVAYMATNREGEMRFTDSPDAAWETQQLIYAWLERERMRRALHEIAEEWAGAECGEPVHAQEAYAIGLAKRMYALAVEGLTPNADLSGRTRSA